MTYFTADLHFGHAGIIGLCDRPFADVDEMNEALVDRWNKKVKKNDTVYIVGDLAWKRQDAETYIPRLNGKKILILGNHDKWYEDEDLARHFVKIVKYEEVSLEGHPITLCHYPMIEWKNSRKEGTSRLGYLVYGHIHNNIKPEYSMLFAAENALNAGADVDHFEPVTFEELKENNAAFSKIALARLEKQVT